MLKQTKARILYLRTDLGTQHLIGGGSVAHTLGILKGFLTDDIFVVCASTAMHAVLAKLDIFFMPLAMPQLSRVCGFKLNSLLSNIIFYFKLKKCIREHHVNLIYQRYSMLNCVGVALAHCFKIPLYLEYNGSESWVDKHWSSNRRLKINWLVDKIELLNLQHAAKIIVVSQVLKEQLLERGIDIKKICVSPNGVDPDIFDAEGMHNERKRLRTTLALQEKFVFGFSGTFGPWHGIEVLADIIPKIARSNPRAHFLLIGDGSSKQQLYKALTQAKVLHRATFTGMVNNDQVPAYLAVCDAFVCPTQPNADGTRFFGSPTKLFEYMMMGKPIIASNIEQIGQILRQDVQHLLVRHDNHEGFVQTAIDLMQMPEGERIALGDALQHRARRDHTWHAHVHSFMSELAHE